MRKLLVAWGLVVAGAVVNTAAQFDMAAIQKWQAAKVVHYSVVGTFRAATPLAGESGGTIYALVGKPAFTNAPSQVISANSGTAECPPPAVKGPYEHFELTAIEPGRDTLT